MTNEHSISEAISENGARQTARRLHCISAAAGCRRCNGLQGRRDAPSPLLEADAVLALGAMQRAVWGGWSADAPGEPGAGEGLYLGERQPGAATALSARRVDRHDAVQQALSPGRHDPTWRVSLQGEEVGRMLRERYGGAEKKKKYCFIFIFSFYYYQNEN